MPCRLGGVKIALRLQLGDDPAALVPIGRRRPPHGVGRERPLGHQQRQLRRGRLRGPRGVPGDVARRRRPLLDVEERPASLAIEHEQPAGLGGLGDGRHDPAVARHVHEHRLRRQVVVPQVVVHRLERPHERAGGRPQGDQGVGVGIRARPETAEEVGARAAGGDEHEIAGRIDVEDGPGITGPGPSRLAVERAPPPAFLPGAGVEGADHAATRIGVPVVADRRAGDHQRAGHRRRRRHLVVGWASRTGAGRKADFPALAEARARLAGGGIERDQPRVDGAGKDALRTGRLGRGIGVAPRRDPTRGHFAVAAGAVDSGVEAPDLGASRRIERDHAAEGGSEVEPSIEMNRRGLEGELAAVTSALAELAGAVGPGGLQPGDVRGGEAVEGREPCTAGPGVGRPLIVGDGRAGGSAAARRGQQAEHSGDRRTGFSAGRHTRRSTARPGGGRGHRSARCAAPCRPVRLACRGASCGRSSTADAG